jgi:hypothetical protein
MALDLAGGNHGFAGAEGTEPAHCRLKSRYNPPGTGKYCREITEKASGKISGDQRWPVEMGGRPVKTPGSRWNAGPGQSSWQALVVTS